MAAPALNDVDDERRGVSALLLSSNINNHSLELLTAILKVFL